MNSKNKKIIDKSTLNKYKKTVNGNVSDIKDILAYLKIENPPPISIFKNILSESSEEIAQKWFLGRKYCRTYFVKKAFGNLYPEKYTDLSLSIDVMINILDDLLDENLDEKTKTNYIIEFLRVSSVLYNNPIKKEIQESLKTYYEKLITLAITEEIYQKQIKNEITIDKIIQDSVDLLICRGTDIDVFVDIALLEISNKKLSEKIRKLARMFRAINILRKDILDIEHDKKNNIDTIVTLMFAKGSNNFTKYINSVTDSIIERVSLLVASMNKKEIITPIKRFQEAINNEQKIIEQLISH